jgi:hypothetical protein
MTSPWQAQLSEAPAKPVTASTPNWICRVAEVKLCSKSVSPKNVSNRPFLGRLCT